MRGSNVFKATRCLKMSEYSFSSLDDIVPSQHPDNIKVRRFNTVDKSQGC